MLGLRPCDAWTAAGIRIDPEDGVETVEGTNSDPGADAETAEGAVAKDEQLSPEAGNADDRGVEQLGPRLCAERPGEPPAEPLSACFDKAPPPPFTLLRGGGAPAPTGKRRQG